MSSILPYDIISQIIDTVGEHKDTNPLKDLALVSHSFHQICCKQLFATVELHDADPKHHLTSSKKGFVKLLTSRPDVVQYIRKLTYEVTHNDNDHRLSLILPNFLQTISSLNCLTINCFNLDWNKIDSSLTSALLYLMHLPTVNHIDLSFIQNFPLSSLIPSVNLLRLDINSVEPFLEEEEEMVIQSEIMPKIREFQTTFSILLTTKLLHAKKQDGQPAFNFTDLRRLTTCHGDEQNIRYLLRNAKLLEHFHLSSIECDQGLEGIHDILSVRAGTLKSFDLTLVLYEEYDGTINLPFEALCKELEAMAGHNVLEALSFEVQVIRSETADDIGSMIQNVEEVLVKPGWSALRQVTFKVPVVCCLVEECTELAEELQSLIPNKYLGHLSKLESVALNFSSYIVKCYGH